MKKTTRIISLLMAAVLVIACFAGCGEKTEDDNLLKVGTNAEFEPFEYIEGDEIVGYDIEVANEIAKDMGKKISITNINFDSLTGALQSGMFDMVIAGMSATPDRMLEVDFSKPYYTASQRVIIRKSSLDATSEDKIKITDLKDLDGKAIAVQEGTTGDIYVSGDDLDEGEELPIKDAKVIRYKKAADCGMALKNGNVGAVVIDEEPAKRIVAQNDELVMLDDILTEEVYAIAVRKGDEELLKAINASIDRMEKDGTFKKIKAEYIPENQ